MAPGNTLASKKRFRGKCKWLRPWWSRAFAQVRAEVRTLCEAEAAKFFCALAEAAKRKGKGKVHGPGAKGKGKGTGKVHGPQDTLEDDLEDTLEEDLEALLSDEEARLERYRSLVAIIEWRLRCSGC